MFSALIDAKGDADKSEFLLGLKCTSSKGEEDTDGICAPLEARKTQGDDIAATVCREGKCQLSLPIRFNDV